MAIFGLTSQNGVLQQWDFCRFSTSCSFADLNQEVKVVLQNPRLFLLHFSKGTSSCLMVQTLSQLNQLREMIFFTDFPCRPGDPQWEISFISWWVFGWNHQCGMHKQWKNSQSSFQTMRSAIKQHLPQRSWRIISLAKMICTWEARLFQLQFGTSLESFVVADLAMAYSKGFSKGKRNDFSAYLDHCISRQDPADQGLRKPSKSAELVAG